MQKVRMEDEGIFHRCMEGETAMSSVMDSATPSAISLECRLATRLGRLALASALVPFGFLIGVYTEWLAGWWIIGHPPIAFVDDPRYIDSPVLLAWATVILFLLGFPATFLSIWCMAYQLYLQFPKTLAGAVRGLVPILLLIFSYSMLQLDPGRIIEWYFD